MVQPDSQNRSIASAVPLLGSSIFTAVIFYTTFAKVITVPVVSSYVGGNLFEITRYVRNLTALYAPWLNKMMNESTGNSTAALLRIGAVALVVLECAAITALALLLLHLVLAALSHAKASRWCGIAGYVLAMLVPLAMIAATLIVANQMSSDLVSLEVLSLPIAPKVQLAAAILGGVCALMATRRVSIPEDAR